ncbi:hypothetical protein NDU88_006806 [Pleurodeles waltl]|uniref:Uncharacterized protein n=1 Tax=Pleurodeles waltl TaxID=8319 RepID=A0AAV7RML8_PLEWA|nr:hypothetical protein NDU88_006806 [Pleurodeles waltl]
MAGFKFRAWIVARGRRPTLHSLMFRFVMLSSLLVVKVSEPLVFFDVWREGPHLHKTFVSSQPRAAAAASSLFCRGCHFGLRQPRSFRGELSGRSLLQGGAPLFLLVLYILRSLLFNPQDLRSSLWQDLNFGLDCGSKAPRYAAFADVPLHTVALAVCGEGV